MTPIARSIAVASLAAAAFIVAPAALADDEKMNADLFVKMADKNKDGMVSKDEFMKHADTVWSKMKTKEKDKMSMKELEAFLKELMKGGG